MNYIAVKTKARSNGLFCKEEDFSNVDNVLTMKNVFIHGMIKEKIEGREIVEGYKLPYMTEIHLGSHEWSEYVVLNPNLFKEKTWIDITEEEAKENFGKKIQEYTERRKKELEDIDKTIAISNANIDNILAKAEAEKKAFWDSWWKFWK